MNLSSGDYIEKAETLTRVLFNIDNYHIVFQQLREHANRKISIETAHAYNAEKNRYIGFFKTVEASLLISCTVQFHTYFISSDKGSLRNLVNGLQSSGIADRLKEVEDFGLEYGEYLDQISVYRDKLYAHRDNIDASGLIYPSARMIETIFDHLLNILNLVRADLGLSEAVFLHRDSRQASFETKALLDDLLKANGSKDYSEKIRKEYFERYDLWKEE